MYDKKKEFAIFGRRAASLPTAARVGLSAPSPSPPYAHLWCATRLGGSAAIPLATNHVEQYKKQFIES
jgi:hypothetical protein